MRFKVGEHTWIEPDVFVLDSCPHPFIISWPSLVRERFNLYAADGEAQFGTKPRFPFVVPKLRREGRSVCSQQSGRQLNKEPVRRLQRVVNPCNNDAGHDATGKQSGRGERRHSRRGGGLLAMGQTRPGVPTKGPRSYADPLLYQSSGMTTLPPRSGSAAQSRRADRRSLVMGRTRSAVPTKGPRSYADPLPDLSSGMTTQLPRFGEAAQSGQRGGRPWAMGRTRTVAPIQGSSSYADPLPTKSSGMTLPPRTLGAKRRAAWKRYDDYLVHMNFVGWDDKFAQAMWDKELPGIYADMGVTEDEPDDERGCYQPSEVGHGLPQQSRRDHRKGNQSAQDAPEHRQIDREQSQLSSGESTDALSSDCSDQDTDVRWNLAKTNGHPQVVHQREDVHESNRLLESVLKKVIDTTTKLWKRKVSKGDQEKLAQNEVGKRKNLTSDAEPGEAEACAQSKRKIGIQNLTGNKKVRFNPDVNTTAGREPLNDSDIEDLAETRIRSGVTESKKSKRRRAVTRGKQRMRAKRKIAGPGNVRTSDLKGNNQRFDRHTGKVLPSEGKATVEKLFLIPAMSEANVPAHFVGDDRLDRKSQYLFEPTPLENNKDKLWRAAACLVQRRKSGRLFIRVMNPTKAELILYAGTPLGTWEHLSKKQIMSITTLPNDSSRDEKPQNRTARVASVQEEACEDEDKQRDCATREDLLAKVNDDNNQLSSEERDRIFKLLWKYSFHVSEDAWEDRRCTTRD